MIPLKAIHDVIAAVVPLYVSMILGYGSVKWWKIFTPEQCSGINTFVAIFAVPFLSFHFISSNNPYTMNFRFLAADSLQKTVVLSALFLYQIFSKHGSIDWTITLFSLSTIPNTLVMGIPLLKAMYGDGSGNLMVQIVVMQGVIWYTLLLFLFEYRGARILIIENFPDTAKFVASIRVNSDISSFSNDNHLIADAEIDHDGKLHVVVRKSNVPSLASSFRSTNISINSARIPDALAGVEIYSIASSIRSISSFNESESVKLGLFTEFYSQQSSKRFPSQMSGRSIGDNCRRQVSVAVDPFPPESSASTGMGDVVKGINDESKNIQFDGGLEIPANGDGEFPLTYQREIEPKKNKKPSEMPPVGVMFRLILTMVGRKLITNLNTYASILGLAWSFILFRRNVQMPTIIKGSISILSNTGLGMATFSLGLFMASQPKIVSCGKWVAMFAMAVRFLVGPAVIAATSMAVGLHGALLRVAIVQAALPLGIAPFVFAKEYRVHSEIQATSVVFGMLIALPITIIYYLLLGR